MEDHDMPLSPYSRHRVDPILPLKDAAVIAGCHPDTLKNEARRGKLSLLRISQRRIGVRESEFNRYLNSRIWGGLRTPPEAAAA
jgi:hypothetical protein